MRTLLLALIVAVAHAQSFVDVGDGVRLFVEEHGKGTPIIVVHGGPGMDHGSLAADLAPLDWTADLAKVKAPVLIIHGDEDAIPMAMVNGWVTALPNARVLRLKQTAHFPHAERPTIVFPAIEKFLRGGWPAGAAR